MFRPASFAAFFSALLAVLNMSWMAPAFAQQGPADATKLVFYNASNADVPVLVTVPGACAVSFACAQQDGCPTGSMQTLNYIDLTAGGQPTPFNQFTAPTKGWFLLKRGHTVQVLNVGKNQYTGQPSSCLQGLNFGFGTFSATCPDSTAVPPVTSVANQTTVPITTPGPTFNNPMHIALPNGSTGFEATINLPGTVKGQSSIPNPACQYGNPPMMVNQDCNTQTVSCPNPPCPKYVALSNAQEAIDITCVNGSNCTLSVQVTAPSTGPFWQPAGTNTFNRSTFSFQNSWVDIKNKCDNNCVDPATGLARPGVFPYGCTVCNVFGNSLNNVPPCTGAGSASAQFCAAKNNLTKPNGCQFVRNPLVAGSQKFGGTIQVTYLGPLSPPGTCPPGSRQ